MREQGQVSLKPVGEDFALRKWGVIWRLRNPTEKRAQILTGTGQNQFTKDTLLRIFGKSSQGTVDKISAISGGRFSNSNIIVLRT